MIYGERIRQVRELFEWTQTDVAKYVSVTQPFIAQIESGRANPSEELVQAFMLKTGFQRRFFEAPPDTEFPLGSLLFRSNARITERERKSIRTHAGMAYEVLQRIMAGRSVKEVQVRIPSVRLDPERAAEVTRSELGLSPDSPIKHVIHVLESAGVLVIRLPRAFPNGDAFCVWALDAGGRRPIVVLSADCPADRVRLSACHELGHLVMHQPLPASGDIDKKANYFASALLLPPDAMRSEIGRSTTLETFLSIKLKWGVSVQAAIMRAYHLGLITQRKYQTLVRRLSARGWRKHEPLSTRIPLERPRAFRQIAELVFGRRLDYARIATDVGYPEDFIRALFESHAGRDQPSKPTNEEPRGGKVVKFQRKTLAPLGR